MIAQAVKSVALSKVFNKSKSMNQTAMVVAQPQMTPMTYVPRTRFGKWWQSLSPLERKVYGFTTLGVVVVGSYFGIRAYQRWLKLSKSREVVKETKDTLKDLEKQGIKQSYPDSQYHTWAQSIQQQMDGCGTGIDKLYGIYGKMKNDADINKLIIVYGTRTVDKCGIGTGDFSGDLISTMAYKFSGVEGAFQPFAIQNINSAFAKRGIKFRF